MICYGLRRARKAEEHGVAQEHEEHYAGQPISREWNHVLKATRPGHLLQAQVETEIRHIRIANVEPLSSSRHGVHLRIVHHVRPATTDGCSRWLEPFGSQLVDGADVLLLIMMRRGFVLKKMPNMDLHVAERGAEADVAAAHARLRPALRPGGRGWR